MNVLKIFLSGFLFYSLPLLTIALEKNNNGNQISMHGVYVNEDAQKVKDETSARQTGKPAWQNSCRHLKGLSSGQLKHCELYKDHMEIVGDGIRTSLYECQKQFKYHRWNCTLSPDRRTFFGPIFKTGYKEASYLQAVVSAGIMHAVAKACKEGQLTRCGCSTLPRPQDLNKEWLWRGCGDNLEYAYKFTKNLMDIKEHEKIHGLEKKYQEYSDALMALHNNEAGRRAVLKQAKITCKCHGVSGSCALITCWHQLPVFPEIGDFITRKYHSAIKVRKNKRGRLQIRNANGKRSTVTDLVYVHTSPDFCSRNHTDGILGTESRSCSPNFNQTGNCEEICCGRGFHAQKILTREKCNCKFNWCCYVKCDYCVSPKEITTCK